MADERKTIVNTASSSAQVRKRTLLCIDYASNWYATFGPKATLKNGELVVVEQCQWKVRAIHFSPARHFL